jgi:HTH-type transcriptional regulator / antitoxin HipB
MIIEFITVKAAMISLPGLVKIHRRKAALTQAQLAKLAGIGKTAVWDIENGKESVQWDTLQKIFRVLNITVEWRSPLIDRMASKDSVLAPSPDASSSLLKSAASDRSAASSPTPE